MPSWHSHIVRTRQPISSSARLAFLVTCDVPGQLRIPIGLIRRWASSAATTGVLMPETPVYEYDSAMLRQHQVRRAGQVAAMEAEPVSHSMNEASDGNLGTRIHRSDARHDSAPLVGRIPIAHVTDVFF